MESFAFESASVYAVGKLNSPSGWGAASGADRLMHPLLNLLYGVGTIPVNSKESLSGHRSVGRARAGDTEMALPGRAASPSLLSLSSVQ